MNKRTQNLLGRAKRVALSISEKEPRRRRYPEELKKIVRVLFTEHGVAACKIASFLAISQNTIQLWINRQNIGRVKFKKISVKKENTFFNIRATVLLVLILQVLSLISTLSLH